MEFQLSNEIQILKQIVRNRVQRPRNNPLLWISIIPQQLIKISFLSSKIVHRKQFSIIQNTSSKYFRRYLWYFIQTKTMIVFLVLRFSSIKLNQTNTGRNKQLRVVEIWHCGRSPPRRLFASTKYPKLIVLLHAIPCSNGQNAIIPNKSNQIIIKQPPCKTYGCYLCIQK